MKTQNLQLLPATAHGTSSGNYDGSSSDFFGVPAKAAGYYSNFNLQTAVIFTTDFTGQLIIEATLASSSDTENWFEVYTITGSLSDLSVSENITGNFTWIRARVKNFTQGSIDSVSISY